MLTKNEARTIVLAGLKNPDGTYAIDPSLSVGDVQLSKDGAAFVNIGTLPTVVAGTSLLAVALTADELNCDTLIVRFTVSGLLTAFGEVHTQTLRDDIGSDVDTFLTDYNLDIVSDTVDAILVDTNELQQNQLEAADVTTDIIASAPFASLISSTVVTATAPILEDTNELQQNPAGGLTDAQDTKLDAIYTAAQPNRLIVQSNMSADGCITIVRGATMTEDTPHGAIDLFVESSLIDLTDTTGTWELLHHGSVVLTKTIEIINPNAVGQAIRFELTDTDTNALELGAAYSYRYTVTIPANPVVIGDTSKIWKPESGTVEVVE